MPMRIMWRGLELPGRVVRDEAVSTDRYARFVIEPFEQGFGTTIGNSLRRVLLSSLEGAAITAVKIAGVSHEFASIDGVLEDVTDILLNMKGVVLRLDGDGPKKLTLQREAAGAVTAGDITADPTITIANPEHHLATLTADVAFSAEMTVNTGRGYATAHDNRSPEQELGVIPIDSVFSPVVRVRYRTEDMRVGQRTNYDRLILEVWTKGTVLPEDALLEAGMILRKHLNPFVMYHELGEDVVTPSKPGVETASVPDSATEELLNKPVSILSLSVRASNCLEAARITTLRDLVTKTEGDLLRVRSFGKTSLHEVQRKLGELNFTLGMRLDEAGAITPPEEAAAPVAEGEESTPPPAEEASEDSDDSSVNSGSTTGAGPMEVFTMPD
jgi:DNA-directed RNA polymerase subunit alpha